MSSLNLLNMLRDRKYYERFEGFVNKNALQKEERQLLKDMQAWFLATPSCTLIDWNVFRGWFFSVAHPSMSDINADVFNQMLDKLDEYEEPDEAFAHATLDAFLKREMCGKLAEISLAGYEGAKSVDVAELETILEEYKKTRGDATDLDSYLVLDDINELTESVTEGGLEWRHEELNKSVGNLRKGKLVLFGARPNYGKTSFLADNVTHMASQLEDDEVVLWFNNEEAGREVKFRLVESGTSMDSATIKADPARAKRKYEQAVGGWNKIVLVDKADLHIRDVEAICSRYKVGLIIFDQLWKVHGLNKEAGSDAQRLQMLYQWARELAKTYGPVISSHQTDYSAEGQIILNMGQLHMNKTGIQGECDTIILMGRNFEPGEELHRYFSVVKNKGAYGPRVIPNLREHNYVMEIQPEIGRYK